VEAEAFAAANLVDKMETGALAPCPIFSDVTKFDGRPFRGLVDIISGGFPCTPFSCAGLRESDESANHLFPYILNAVQDIQPSLVFLENVEGIITAKLKGDGWRDEAGTPVLLHVLRELERIGYRSTWGIFSAAEVGAPHQRKRVFILARMANAGRKWREVQAWRQDAAKQITRGDGAKGRAWPARPGEWQYGWEEPRVLADPSSQRPKRLSEKREQVREASRRRRPDNSGSVLANVGNAKSGENDNREARDMEQEAEGGKGCDSTARDSSRRQAEPELGGTTDGIAGGLDAAFARVERLRMLGNGVVPDTATKAFLTLMNQLDG
tara:strand:+ start:254 stop:1228 length:975 start_codon:yes stop_codon:yes gene_type:complete